METPTIRGAVDLRQDILKRITSDSRVDASDIHVDVSEEGAATLSGSVPTYAERRFVVEDTYFAAGVVTVENRLEVRFPESAAVHDDDALAANIMNILLWDTNIDTTEVQVTADKGRVTLTGTVDSFWQKHKAEEMAGNVTGVTAVDNRLTVQPEETLTDSEIKENIRTTLENSVRDDAGSISVEVSGGAVRLSGTVSDAYVRTAAGNIARYSRSVTDVKNDLKVGG
jgi:osmotically-inducible protein OsmY